MSERRYWLSWHALPGDGPYTLNTPWWISGEDTDGNPSICAAVHAENEDDAWGLIRLAHDVPPHSMAQRFISERPADWAPFSDRFRRADWMVWP